MNVETALACVVAVILTLASLCGLAYAYVRWIFPMLVRALAKGLDED